MGCCCCSAPSSFNSTTRRLTFFFCRSFLDEREALEVATGEDSIAEIGEGGEREKENDEEAEAEEEETRDVPNGG